MLSVLRNTMVGLQQVDQSVIEAGRGMGLSKRQALLGIELPLAVPVILAGVRVAVVLATTLGGSEAVAPRLSAVPVIRARPSSSTSGASIVGVTDIHVASGRVYSALPGQLDDGGRFIQHRLRPCPYR